MQFDGEWTLGLPGGSSPPADDTAPLVTNGKVGVVLKLADTGGLDTSRAVVAASASSGAGYGTLVEAFHPCHFKLLTANGEELRQTLLVSDDPLMSLSLDMAGAVLYAPFICVHPSNGQVVCVAVHSIRALRHMPHFLLHTLAITVSPGCQNGFQVLHELRADPSLSDARFDSTVIDAGRSEGTYILTAHGRSSDAAADVFASSAYLTDEPELLERMGFNVRRHSKAAFTRMRLRAHASGLEHTYAIHVLTGTMTSTDDVSAGEQLRRIIISQLNIGGESSGGDIVSSICNRHMDAWNKLWMSEVWFDVKPGATVQEAADARRFQGMLRLAVYNLHASARPGSVVDLGGTVENGAGDAWIVPALLLFQTDAGLSALDAHHTALHDATKAAAAFGYRGAKFPFKGDDANGAIGALYYDAEEPLHVFNCSLVAIEAWDYYRISMDRDWLQDRGYALLRGVADLIVSVVRRDADSATLYHFYNVVGFEDKFAPAVDNALTVASAITALRCAMEASYELGFSAKESWVAVRYGLVVPSAPGTDVVLRDASALPTSAPASSPSQPQCMQLEMLLLLQPQLRDAMFGPDSGRSFSGALKQNVQAWAPLYMNAASKHPVDRMILAQAYAQLAQSEVAAADAQLAATAFATCFSDVIASAQNSWGNLVGYDTFGAFNNLNLSAMLLLAITHGLGGISLTGGVTETRFYYAEMGVVAAFSSAMPMSWERLYVRGVGPAQKDFSILNHLLYPSARINDASVIVPWSVSALF